MLRVFAPEAVLRELRAAGFGARATRRYGTFPLPPRRLAFVARKR